MTFESQAAHVKRLGLLLEGEAQRIAASACRPEKIGPRPDPDEVEAG